MGRARPEKIAALEEAIVHGAGDADAVANVDFLVALVVEWVVGHLVDLDGDRGGAVAEGDILAVDVGDRPLDHGPANHDKTPVSDEGVLLVGGAGVEVGVKPLGVLDRAAVRGCDHQGRPQRNSGVGSGGG